MARIVAAVLAGGASTRMGADKVSMEVSGRPMSRWVARALDEFETYAVGGEIPGLAWRADEPGAGPLRGVAAALHIDATAVFITAVDHPWLRRRTVAALVERFDGRPVVPLADGLQQVMCAVYPTTLAAQATDLADRGAPVRALFDGVAIDAVDRSVWETWDEDGRSWFSVDTPAQVMAGLERFGPPGTAE